MGQNQSSKLQAQGKQMVNSVIDQAQKKLNFSDGDIFHSKSKYETAEEKGVRIQETVQKIDSNLKNAAKLLQDGMVKDAKELYVEQAEAVMKLMKETDDDENFKNALKFQLKVILDKAEVCKNQLERRRNTIQPGAAAAVINQRILPQTQVQNPQISQQHQYQPNPANHISQQQNQVMSNGGMDPQIRKQMIQKLDQNMLKVIMETILDAGPGVKWEDIEGLHDIKKAMVENIIYPQLRPDVFTGLRAPTKGILLYGPPGNGKTMIAKAVATECKSTFFSISASTLVSKWMGESEKLMRTLFQLAAIQSPSIIFIDEIDSILTKRSSEEQEASRRLKTEFLIQLDGVGSSETRILVIAATNRPFDLDEAALRRLTKRIYIGLPDKAARLGLIKKLLKQVQADLSQKDLDIIAKNTNGYSSADLTAFVKDAAMEPIRELPPGQLMRIQNANQIRKVNRFDFEKAFQAIRPSVSQQSLQEYATWHKNNAGNC